MVGISIIIFFFKVFIHVSFEMCYLLFFYTSNKRSFVSLVPVAHACNPRYSGGRDQDDYSSKPVWTNSLWYPISKNPTQKNRTGRVAEVVEYLLSKCEALSSNPNNEEKKKVPLLGKCLYKKILANNFLYI
jgi:hypothetical protein